MSIKFNPFTQNLDYVGDSTPPVVSASTNLTVSLKNNSGSTIAIYKPVVVNASGGISAINVSSLSEKRVMGVSVASISNDSFGDVVISGEIANITTSFSVGDTLYVGHSGALSNVIPSVGVGSFASGDALIKVGNLTINKDNPSNIDLIVAMELIVLL